MASSDFTRAGCTFAITGAELIFQGASDSVAASGYGQIEGCFNSTLNRPVQANLNIVTMSKVGSMTITFSPSSSSAPTAVLKYSIVQADGTTFEATKNIAKQPS